MTPLEAEARAMGVKLTDEQWQRYREWAAKNPRGGMACNGEKPRKAKENRNEKTKSKSTIRVLHHGNDGRI